MRLIDADELQERMLRYYGDYSFNIYEEIRDFFQNTPTINAIPIEWIKDKMDELEGTGRFELSEYLDELLADWEKENEID